MRRKDLSLIVYAGLVSERKNPASDEPEFTCAILTRAATGAVGKVHERMPVILPDEIHMQWLDPNLTDAVKINEIVRDYAQDDFELIPVPRNGIGPNDDGTEQSD